MSNKIYALVTIEILYAEESFLIYQIVKYNSKYKNTGPYREIYLKFGIYRKAEKETNDRIFSMGYGGLSSFRWSDCNIKEISEEEKDIITKLIF